MECPRDFNCDGCINKNTLNCYFEPQYKHIPSIEEEELWGNAPID